MREYLTNTIVQPSKSGATGRIYVVWIEVGENVVLQFYPPGVEERLARLEMSYRGRQPSEIRVTRFQVVPAGGGYDFKVMAQEALR